mmetsp:Transcript_7522/g.10177  ORF Transcript_7522/g.10177 Transcript_7522/m.10177 type:complete len:507 (+) Transcript_7522:260-1780(+)|eukprot:CAMPEP_0196582172 /NCGR_PEP_ID=MMETSP1081-20130531/37839_1 /TAXON_ID=36882 /ORGANISM="Pyramimonas amylifera, Strain CCMP720" /LENGTH=506 /DNA_ID=CAMNT_0041902665 /DNA_START=256 /DNA_END=1776 /DNA_ORIENTATION=+
MFCSISGQTPEEPVVSKTSGHLYEKRLIEKAISEDGKCPVTGDSLSSEDLLPLRTNSAVKPRPPTATSIPGLLGLLHNEWDALMLEQHATREQLNSVRQELSHALYQHDASTRVVARLLKERDEARAALAAAEKMVATSAAGGAGKRAHGDEESRPDGGKKARAGITSDVVSSMTALSKELSKARKKRQISASLAAKEALEEFTLLASQPLHKSTEPGIMAVDVHPTTPSLLVTGGVDSQVVLFDRAQGKITSTLSGHSKKVTAVQFLPKSPEMVLSASADKTARLWKTGPQGTASQCVATFKDHTGEVTALSVHPTSTYFVTASSDKTWAFHDIEAALCLTSVADASVQGGYTCASFHPDGLILGTGTTENLVRIWDVKSQENVAKFEGHKSPVTSMSFSENGYHLATAAEDGVKLWDLRKPKNFKNLSPYGPGVKTTTVKFDHSGLYLGVGGGDARIYSVKQDWEVVKTFSDIPKTVTAVVFGKDAETVYVCSMDRNLRMYGSS